MLNSKGSAEPGWHFNHPPRGGQPATRKHSFLKEEPWNNAEPVSPNWGLAWTSHALLLTQVYSCYETSPGRRALEIKSKASMSLLSLNTNDQLRYTTLEVLRPVIISSNYESIFHALTPPESSSSSRRWLCLLHSFHLVSLCMWNFQDNYLIPLSYLSVRKLGGSREKKTILSHEQGKWDSKDSSDLPTL